MTNWKIREAGRFLDGTYTPVCWSTDPWFVNTPQSLNHFLHVSTTHPNYVAFTPSEEYGRRDRQTRLRPGRYLSKFFGAVLTSDQIRETVAKFSVELEDYDLIITTSPDTIERVYTSGPHSCMSNKADSYKSHIHPSRVYGDSPDLALAYLTDPCGNIVSRCVVWPEKEQRSIIYGDCDRMIECLLLNGYDATTKHSFEGAHIQKISSEKHPRRFVVPYIDGAYTVSIDDNGKYLVLDSDDNDNGYGCRRLDGFSGHPDDQQCENCEDDCFHEDMETVTDLEQEWCSECIRCNSAICGDCNERVSEANNYCPEINGNVCEICIGSYSECDHCQDYFLSQNLNSITTINNEDKDICNSCLEDYTLCHMCGSASINPNNFTNSDGHNLCTSCAQLHLDLNSSNEKENESATA